MFSILYCHYVVFFFFKQKTAYEMRISDWSSDVCSSDLRTELAGRRPHLFSRPLAQKAPSQTPPDPADLHRSAGQPHQARRLYTLRDRLRSEEHTSELKSLMRISYAVFCSPKHITKTPKLTPTITIIITITSN